MTNDEKIIAIALATGWKPETRKMYGGEKNVKGWGFNTHLSLGSADRKFHYCLFRFPDYLNDLNCMHEVEKVGIKTENEFTSYLGFLLVSTGDQYPICATATQRADAFIKTVGKWKE